MVECEETPAQRMERMSALDLDFYFGRLQKSLEGSSMLVYKISLQYRGYYKTYDLYACLKNCWDSKSIQWFPTKNSNHFLGILGEIRLARASLRRVPMSSRNVVRMSL